MTELVDVPDLGSGFWEFESPSGYNFNSYCPLGEMVDAAALKATSSECRFKSGSGYGSYSLMVKWSIVARLLWVRFPVVARTKKRGDG